ncbi:sodium-dependent proline transporter-like isoform X1 [Condylostylus longicornis]|uniref:sodium-dependent proline transporter-like isoform X1 n=1 Tax=Condylostylus longicornis TaxID=2530218 RepID=UPI00244E508F|nr:sodium-dependent proline transporter-like isoform X1 [Condylostylus longicornis]
MTNNNGNRIPENVTSYDIGNKPYKHDPGRGKWEKTWDFYAIALSHCCGFRHYLIFFALEPASAVIMSIAYMMGMLVFTLPVYFTQMFMGQFSSTGLISVFRIAPLFKSIGYISLFLNVMTCSYFMVATAFPLYIVFESMQTHLPWAHCGNHFNSEECEAIEPGSLNASMNFSDFYYEYSNNRTFPINEYLKYVFNGHDVDNNWYFSWRIMLCTLLIWVLIGLVLYNGVEMFGKIFRYITAITFVCLFLTTLRIIFVVECWEAIQKYFELKLSSFTNVSYFLLSPILTVTAFGAGWGNILTIASYNNFKEDIGKLSLVVCCTQMVVFMITMITYMSVEDYIAKYYGFIYISIGYYQAFTYIFVSYAMFFAHFSWSHFWTILFFLLLFLSQFAEGAVQILTILTAIFDEYEYTRIYKKAILGCLIAFLGSISMFFCTTAGFATVSVLHSMADANKLIIILLELFVIVWIYGRLRFKRDVKFMTGKSIKSWKVWTMRFITPIAIAIALLVYIFESQYYRRFGHILAILIFAILKLTPTMYVPGYMIYKICTATGNVIDRIKKLCRPNDWYPADPIEHQNYENYLDNSDIANELVHANLITETVSF